MDMNATVDRLFVYPISYNVLDIPGGFGFRSVSQSSASRYLQRWGVKKSISGASTRLASSGITSAPRLLPSEACWQRIVERVGRGSLERGWYLGNPLAPRCRTIFPKAKNEVSDFDGFFGQPSAVCLQKGSSQDKNAWVLKEKQIDLCWNSSKFGEIPGTWNIHFRSCVSVGWRTKSLHEKLVFHHFYPLKNGGLEWQLPSLKRNMSALENKPNPKMKCHLPISFQGFNSLGWSFMEGIFLN